MFTEVIVAIYETDEDAEHAVAEMLAAHVPESAIHRHTKADMPEPAPAPPPADEQEHVGFWARMFGGHSTEHAVYDQALHNGGNVVTVTTVPDNDFEPVMAILERHNPIDLEEMAASFTGIAHSPDPVVRGSEAMPTDNKPLFSQSGPRVRRFAVAPPLKL
jgi:hypothetical protein